MTIREQIKEKIDLISSILLFTLNFNVCLNIIFVVWFAYFFKLFIYLFVLGLYSCKGFSLVVVSGGCSLVSARGRLIAVVSPAVEHRL